METAFINRIDTGVITINRKYAKRFMSGRSEEKNDVNGYENFKEAGRDIEILVDLVWVSGTPSLQIPYLLSLALLVLTFVPSFPPAPRTMFRLLRKLDIAFASLLQGRDLDTGEALPGFTGGRGVSATEKVRIKGLVEKTRVTVVDILNKGGLIDEDEEGEDSISQAENDPYGLDEISHVDMDVARVYDRTIVELGDTLGGPSLGIPDK